MKGKAHVEMVVEDLRKLGKIILLQRKSQEAAWIETIIQLKMMSPSLQREQPTQMWNLSTSSRGMTICGLMWEG
jgi:hypothetical protein